MSTQTPDYLLVLGSVLEDLWNALGGERTIEVIADADVVNYIAVQIGLPNYTHPVNGGSWRDGFKLTIPGGTVIIRSPQSPSTTMEWDDQEGGEHE